MGVWRDGDRHEHMYAWKLWGKINIEAGCYINVEEPNLLNYCQWGPLGVICISIMHPNQYFWIHSCPEADVALLPGVSGLASSANSLNCPTSFLVSSIKPPVMWSKDPQGSWAVRQLRNKPVSSLSFLSSLSLETNCKTWLQIHVEVLCLTSLLA